MEKTALQVRVYGDPVLRKTARRVTDVTEKDRSLLSHMAQTMYASSGIGLAAPQVGVSKAMIVADIGQGLYKLVNPRIIRRAGRQALEEGCLSVPGICIKVKRSLRVTVKALDEKGKPVSVQAEGLLACVLQHEIDHLKGILIVDYASLLARLKIKRKLQELQKFSTDENLPETAGKSCQLHL